MRSPLTVLLLVAMLSACSARRSPQQKIPGIGHRETGEASWYGEPYHGRRAANGEVYDMEKLTAAHRTFPFDTWLRVVNLSNDKSVVVRITDRGPFVGRRIIDLSRAAAREIEMLQAGVTKVRLEVIARPPSTPSVEAAPSVAPLSGGRTKDQEGVSSLPRFTLQAGAFRDESNARALAQRLSTLVSLVRVSYDLATLTWKVTAGAFDTPQESDGLASLLRRQGIDIFVVEWGR